MRALSTTTDIKRCEGKILKIADLSHSIDSLLLEHD